MPRASRRPAWLSHAANWAQFAAYCQRHGLAELPAAAPTVAAFLAWYASGHTWPSVRRVCEAIASAHRAASELDPTEHPAVLEALRAIASALERDRLRRRSARASHS